jgi:molybdopterin/thiamine biosynthesis adenylyltransferase
VEREGGALSASDKERYKRQLTMERFGEKSQLRLARARVAILGVGGLGSPAAMYLAAAGVGTLILVDDQVPELSNLNRQVLHWQRDVAEAIPKVESAAWKIKEMNPEIRVTTRFQKVTEDNIAEALDGSDLVLDCTDNFQVRMSLNRFCLSRSRPFVHAGVEGMHGQITTIIPGETPCLRCLFPQPPAAGSGLSIIGAAAGVFGSMQAIEAIKLITGFGRPLQGRILVGDLEAGWWEEVEVGRYPSCPDCSGVRPGE